MSVIPGHNVCVYAVRHGTTRAYWSREPETPHTTLEITLIFSLFGAVALTLVVPAIRGMYRR